MADTFAFLKARFQRALLLGLGTPGLLVGCGPGEGIENDAGFVEVTCGNYGYPQLLAGLEPAEPFDYLERGQLGYMAVSYVNQEQVGELCGGASDRDACRTALRELPKQTSLMLGESGFLPSSNLIRVTRGDEVLMIASQDELRDFLGPIDTTSEAVLLASSAGYGATCSRSGARLAGTLGYAVQMFTHPGCDGRRRHLIYVSSDGAIEPIDSVTEEGIDHDCVVGRRPVGLVGRGRTGRSVGAYFARSAELEAASVPAFETLERELVAHGAPRSFALRARSARRDEVRHARDVAWLARSLGGKPCKPRVVPLTEVRSLEAIALENAVEGCVRETYGALVAQHQAARARLPVVRRLHARIAEDETRHAALAWDVARWVEARASVAERRHVRAALQNAVHELSESTREPVDHELVEVAGLPRPDAARVMLGALEQTLWV